MIREGFALIATFLFGNDGMVNDSYRSVLFNIDEYNNKDQKYFINSLQLNWIIHPYAIEKFHKKFIHL